jgi:hypothetical protein
VTALRPCRGNGACSASRAAAAALPRPPGPPPPPPPPPLPHLPTCSPLACLQLTQSGLFTPGSLVSLTNTLGTCLLACTSDGLPDAVLRRGAPWPPSITTNVFDLAWCVPLLGRLAAWSKAAAAFPRRFHHSIWCLVCRLQELLV